MSTTNDPIYPMDHLADAFKGVKGWVVIILCMISLGLVVALMWMGYVQREVAMRSAIEAQQDSNKASHDTMWKILKDQAGVTDEYKEAFEKIYPQLISGRYQDKGLLLKFVTESNPTFDTSLYKKLMASIEAERKTFLRDQKKLRDLKREHDILLKSPPSSWFLAGKQPIDVVLVTSDRSEAAFETGKDNESLYPDKKK